MTTFETQVHKAFNAVFLAASAVALAVILGHSTLANLDSSKSIGERHSRFEKVSHVVELPKAITQPLVECTTDSDCKEKNPEVEE